MLSSNAKNANPQVFRTSDLQQRNETSAFVSVSNANDARPEAHLSPRDAAADDGWRLSVQPQRDWSSTSVRYNQLALVHPRCIHFIVSGPSVTMDASDVAYTAQMDKKEALLLQVDPRRKRARSVASRQPLQTASLATAVGIGIAPPASVAIGMDADASALHEPVWETSLFAFSDASYWHCCLAVALPCAIASHVEATIDRGSCGAGAFFLGLAFIAEVACALQSVDMAVRDAGVDHDDQSWTTQYRSERLSLNMWGVAALVAAAVFAAGVFALRNMTRHYYHLPGSCGADAAIATACAPCAMAQISRQFEIAGPSVYAEAPGRAGGSRGRRNPVDTIPAYQECC